MMRQEHTVIGRERSVCHPLFHVPDSRNKQVWIKAKLGARIFLVVSPMDCTISYCLPRNISTKRFGSKVARSRCTLTWDAGPTIITSQHQSPKLTFFFQFDILFITDLKKNFFILKYQIEIFLITEFFNFWFWYSLKLYS